MIIEKGSVKIRFAVFFLLMFFIGYFAANAISADKKDRDTDALLAASMEMWSKTLPKMIDEETSWDSVKTEPGKKVIYMYSMPNFSKEDFDEAEIQTFKKEQKEFMADAVKKEPGMKMFRDREVTMKYVYNDKNGQEILSFEVTPKDYK